MAVGYKITDKEMKRLWLVLSKDSFVCNENLSVIEQICRKNGIDDDSMSYFTAGKTDWDEVYDLVLTPSFFGERLPEIHGKSYLPYVRNYKDYSTEYRKCQ